MAAYAIIVAAGRSARMGGGNKLLMPLMGKPVLAWTIDTFETVAQIEGIILVAVPSQTPVYKEMVAKYAFKKVIAVIDGGERRQDSVQRGLNALPKDAQYVLVHDGARPLTPKQAIIKCLDAAKEHGSGIASCPVVDTIKVAAREGHVMSTPDRATLRAVQTPQAFRAQLLIKAYETAQQHAWTATDDASLVERMGEKVMLVDTGYGNVKITTPEDIPTVERLMCLTGKASAPEYLTGVGYDVHRLVEGRALTLCGVTIPFAKGLLGHSDADVGLHALMDALLGAAGLGDIGQLFPDSDEKYKGISSMELLYEVMGHLGIMGYQVANADICIVAQQPKIAPYREIMQDNVKRMLLCDRVNVKATTTEGMGFEGEGLGMSAYATCLIMRAR